MASNANADVDKLTTFGKMALEQGWYDQARECFQQALTLDTTNEDAAKGLALADKILVRKEILAAKLLQVPASLPATQADAGFNVAGCITSFVVTLVFAIIVGLAVLFFVTVIVTGVVGPLGLSGGGADVFPIGVRTGIAYLVLLGAAWWAVYKATSTER